MFEIIVVIPGILFSITIHEAMHAYVSHALGDDTAYLHGRVTLNPLKHIDPFTTIILPILLVLSGLPPFAAAKPVPFNPHRLRFGEYGAALVGVAGPLSNLAIAVFLAVWTRAFIGFDATIISEIMKTLIGLNLALFVFNMIPFPPLDGSRLLYAFAPDSLRRVMASIEATGLIGFAIFFFVFYSGFSGFVAQAVTVLFEAITGQPSPYS